MILRKSKINILLSRSITNYMYMYIVYTVRKTDMKKSIVFSACIIIIFYCNFEEPNSEIRINIIHIFY